MAGISASTLASKIVAKSVAKFGTADDAALLQEFAEVIAEAIVDEFAANGTVTVNSVTGVSTGGGTSGPGTGTVDTQ